MKEPNNYAQDIVVDGSRMRDELGYLDLHSVEEGVQRTLAWTRANPPERYNPRLLDYAMEDAAVAAYREAMGAR